MSDINFWKEELSKGGIGRHETFTPRYGWLKKGYEAAKEEINVFTAPDCIERLGVGKNMVRSIRYWCLTYHLIQHRDGESRKGQKGAFEPSDLGNRLLANDGWDPYIEDIATLWLLHWQLFVPPYHAASWPLAFNHCILPVFDLRQLGLNLMSAAQQYEKLCDHAPSSFEKDASCMIRMYAKPNNINSSEIDCPFTQLGILIESEEPNSFRFDIGLKPTLPSLVFAAACFSYANHTQPTQRTLSLHKVVYGFNAPGVAFKLSETEAGRLIDHATKLMDNVEFVEVLGNRQIQFNVAPEELYWEALNRYYNSPDGRVFA